MASVVVEVIRIANNLAWSGQSNQGAIPVADREIDAHVACEDARHHAIGISLAKQHRAFFEGNCHLSLDKLVHRLRRQIKRAQVIAKRPESLLVSVAWLLNC